MKVYQVKYRSDKNPEELGYFEPFTGKLHKYKESCMIEVEKTLIPDLSVMKYTEEMENMNVDPKEYKR